MSSIKIIRTYWGSNTKTINELPPFPIYPAQEVVYVWGIENEKRLKSIGYETRLVSNDPLSHPDYPYFSTYPTQYGNKLISLKLALEEFEEIIMLDWDCYILRPWDHQFYTYLNSKPIQCPLYTQHRDTVKSLDEAYSGEELGDVEGFFQMVEVGFTKYSWKYEEGLVSPNFGFFYTRDKSIGDMLLDITFKNKLEGCIEEHAFQIYANCSLDEYLTTYQPLFVQGVSRDMTDHNLMVSNIQRKLNNYIDSKLPMDLYLKHI
jgi:hypothetical protein